MAIESVPVSELPSSADDCKEGLEPLRVGRPVPTIRLLIPVLTMYLWHLFLTRAA